MQEIQQNQKLMGKLIFSDLYTKKFPVMITNTSNLE